MIQAIPSALLNMGSSALSSGGALASIEGILSGIGNIPILGDALGGLASAFGMDQLFGKPAAEMSFDQNLALQNMQHAYQASLNQQAYTYSQLSADKAAHQEVANAREAWQKYINWYRSRYRTTMADMKMAGLNPILAAGSGGFQIGSGGPQMQARAHSAHAGSGSAAGASMGIRHQPRDLTSAFGLRRAQKGEARARTELSAAQAKESIERAYKTRLELGLVKANERELHMRANLHNNKMQLNRQNILKMQAEIQQINAKTDYTQKDTERVQQLTQNISMERERLSSEILKLEYSLVELRRVANVYDKPVSQLLIDIREIRKAFGVSGHIVGGTSPKQFRRRLRK